MLRLGAPALAEEFLVLMVAWTDWFLASRYFAEDGDATKAAMGLMAYLMWLIPCCFSVVAIGATALIARWTGANDFERASTAANQAYLVAGGFAIGLTALVAWQGQPFIELMQLKGDSADYAYRYLSVITAVIPMIMCSQIGAACLRGAGDTISGFLVKIIVVITNIIVSTLLVTGWGIMEPLGWNGLAIGTAAGYTVGGAVLTALLVFGRAGLQLKWAQLCPDREILRKMFRIGLPGGFDIGALLFSQLLFLGIINSLGDTAAAAHGLAVQIEACAFLPGAAFQVAAATIAGQYIGAKQPRRASIGVLQCLAAGGFIMLVAAISVYFFGEQIASFFTGNLEDPTTSNAAALLRIIAVALPSLAVVMIVSGGFRGAGDTAWPFFFTVLGFFAIRIPLAACLSFETISLPLTDWQISGWGLGVMGAWYAMATDLVIRSLAILARFIHGGWRNVEI